MILWNALIPTLFHGPVLSFWQTAGLFLLSKILLTGVAPGPKDRNRRDWRRKYHNKQDAAYFGQKTGYLKHATLYK
jgi:hypothetical protein